MLIILIVFLADDISLLSVGNNVVQVEIFPIANKRGDNMFIRKVNGIMPLSILNVSHILLIYSCFDNDNLLLIK